MMSITGELPKTETILASTSTARANPSFANALQASGFDNIPQASIVGFKGDSTPLENSTADGKTVSSTGVADVQNLPTGGNVGKTSNLESLKEKANSEVAPQTIQIDFNRHGAKNDSTMSSAATALLSQSQLAPVEQEGPPTSIANLNPPALVPVADAPKNDGEFSDRLPSSSNSNSSHLEIVSNHNSTDPAAVDEKVAGIKPLKNRDALAKASTDRPSASTLSTGSELLVNSQLPVANDPCTVSGTQTLSDQKMSYTDNPSSSRLADALKSAGTGKASSTNISRKASEGISGAVTGAVTITPTEINKSSAATMDDKDDDNKLELAAAQSSSVLVFHGVTNTAPIPVAHTTASADGRRVISASSPTVDAISTSASLQSELHNSAGISSADTGRAGHGMLAATTTATATSLEVGVATGTHGWLKIRAELEGGVVTTSLSSPTQSGREALHLELPSLTAYLQDEKIGVGTVTIRDNTATGSGDGSSDGGLLEQSKQGPRREDDSRSEAASSNVSGPSEDEQMKAIWQGFGSASGFVPSTTDLSGGWLNVRV